MAPSTRRPSDSASSSPILMNGPDRSDGFAPLPPRYQSTRFAVTGDDRDPGLALSPRHTSTGFSTMSAQSTASSTVDPQWAKQCVLSLDGGGIKGYSTLLILREVMQYVRQIEQQNPNENVESSHHPLPHIEDERKRRNRGNTCKFYPCHYFDYIGGTSTGGLISIMLGRLRMSIDECIDEYEQFAGDIFGHPRWCSIRGPIPFPRDKYSGERLQKVVADVAAQGLPAEQSQIGAGTFRSTKELCKTVVVAYEQKRITNLPEYGLPTSASATASALGTRQAVENSGPYLFRSYDHWGSGLHNASERNPGSAQNIPIWQVARATTAAPTYFHPIEIQNRKFGDGGFGTNNPVLELYFEVLQMHGNDAANISLLLSIGTGQSSVSRFADGAFAKYYAYFRAAKKLASDSEETHQNMMRIAGNFDNLKYFRLNVPEHLGLGKVKLDEWKPKGEIRLRKMRTRKEEESTLARIKEFTHSYCQQDDFKNDLMAIAQILVDHRRARCRDTRLWELVSTGVQYRCLVKNCRKSMKLHPCRDSLRRHLITKHNYERDDQDTQAMIDKGRGHFS